MSDDVRFEGLLADMLVNAAPTREPDRLIPDILVAASRARRTPRWLALAREHPMRLHAHVVVGSPNVRFAYILVLPLLLTLIAVGIVVVGASLLPRPTSLVPPERGVFMPTGSLPEGRSQHTATLLLDGRVLVVGGEASSANVGSSRLWDPAAGMFSPTGSLLGLHESHTATLLADGRVLIVGGSDARGELWDPVTGSFSPTGRLAQARRIHTATLLPDGRVLVVGGWEGGDSLATAELYDPATGSFSPTGAVAEGRYSHTATRLPDGRVLVVGGFVEASGRGSGAIASAELWDPATGLFHRAGSLAEARSSHTATLVSNGRVLVVGGWANGGSLASAELWDPTTGSFTPTGSLAEGRHAATATLLPDGRVLVVAGGYGKLPALASAELWDPAASSFTRAGSLAVARREHTATLLLDGRVLIVGGAREGGFPDEVDLLTSAEVYDPAARLP